MLGNLEDHAMFIIFEEVNWELASFSTRSFEFGIA